MQSLKINWQDLMKFSNIATQRLTPYDLNNLIQFSLKHKYPLLVLAHLLLGVLIYLEPYSCRFYSALVFFSGCYYIVRNRDANQQALFAAAYITGSEVLLRMVDGASYEFAKYTVCIFTLLGIFYSGFSRKSWLYVLYFLLLVPSLLLTNDFLHMSRREINVLIMTFSGPICLAFLSIYTFGKRVSFVQMSRLLLFAALPVVAIATKVFLQSPDPELIGSVTSNPHFSGMYGPNQVSTALGLGMFLFFSRAILNSGSRRMFVFNLLLGSFLAYVGLLTFSRGGMITGFCAIITTVVFVFFKSKDYGRSKAKTGLIAFLVCFFAVFSLISYETGGLLMKRYANRDKMGHVRKDRGNDRRSIATKEIKLFIKNPVLGVSVTEAEKIRRNEGKEVHSHSEITRMLAEHGLFGFIGVLILILTPARLLFYKRQNVFLAVFFVFWFLTVNHSGMRLVAPAFFYALMLLQIDLSNATFFCRSQSKRPV
jgi:hypothetical protein